MGIEYKYANDQTDFNQEEIDGLLIKSISTREELNEAEQLNIHKAIEWTLSKKFSPSHILNERFIKQLHKRMYGKVWKWAGIYRKSNKNIGVDKHQIPVELKKLLEDASYWIDHGTFEPEEIAVRFKHRIVCIHCFPNGNGRHSRLMADILISHVFDHKVFTWGAGDLVKDSEARSNYLQALRKADRHDVKPLIQFARSGKSFI